VIPPAFTLSWRDLAMGSSASPSSLIAVTGFLPAPAVAGGLPATFFSSSLGGLAVYGRSFGAVVVPVGLALFFSSSGVSLLGLTAVDVRLPGAAVYGRFSVKPPAASRSFKDFAIGSSESSSASLVGFLVP